MPRSGEMHTAWAKGSYYSGKAPEHVHKDFIPKLIHVGTIAEFLTSNVRIHKLDKQKLVVS